MELHGKAELSLRKRHRLARRVIEEDWSLREAAEAAEVSERTAGKWVRRDGAFGSPGGFLVVRRVSVASGSRRQLRDRIHDGVAARTQRLFGARASFIGGRVFSRV